MAESDSTSMVIMIILLLNATFVQQITWSSLQISNSMWVYTYADMKGGGGYLTPIAVYFNI